MATFPILGANTLPDPSTATNGNVFFEPLTIKSSSAAWPHGCFIFNDTTTRIGLYGVFPVPDDYSTGAEFVVFWDTTAASTNGVKWDFDYRTVANTESIATTSAQESTSLTVASSGVALILNREASTTLTAANFSTGDIVQFGIFRDGSSTTADDLAAAVRLHAALFAYST